LMQDDGNAVIYSNAIPVWATMTARETPPGGCPTSALTLLPGESLFSADRHFYLLYQMDGNLVVYESGAGALWASGTTGSSPGPDGDAERRRVDHLRRRLPTDLHHEHQRPPRRPARHAE